MLHGGETLPVGKENEASRDENGQMDV